MTQQQSPPTQSVILDGLQKRWPLIRWSDHPIADLSSTFLGDERLTQDYCLSRVAVSDESARNVVLMAVDDMLRRWARRQSFPDDLIDDARQQTALTLFGQPPRILEYGGRAPLSAWLQVVSVRQALGLLKSRGGSADDVALDELPWAHFKNDETSPEERVQRRQARQQFSKVFRQVVKRLSSRDRAILSLRFTRGLEVEPLARMYNVHRVTMARWLSDAREQLVDELTAQLPANVGIDVTQLREWLGTNPELSMERLFQLTREMSLHP